MALTREQIDEKIRRFEGLLSCVKRDGMDKLVEFIRKSDFYKAPASTRHHSSFEGGLLHHTLYVYDCLIRKKNEAQVIWADTMQKIDDESIIVMALLHDICKTYYYTHDFKNQKTYDEEKVKAANPKEVKKDNHGAFIWETVPFYTVDDKIPYGHGEKSVMMIEEYIKLKPAERYAIRWHMGFSEPRENYGALGEAIRKYPICWALHEADMEATYILEENDD